MPEIIRTIMEADRRREQWLAFLLHTQPPATLTEVVLSLST